MNDSGYQDEYRIKMIFDLFLDTNEKILISYAWEKDSDSYRNYHCSSERLEYAQALARGADILVVIGYSFPFFNREIDKEIFQEMLNLKKIYFQDPILDGQFLYSQFGLDKKNVTIEHIDNVNNYYVPYEL